jgi:hypothetical protein
MAETRAGSVRIGRTRVPPLFDETGGLAVAAARVRALASALTASLPDDLPERHPLILGEDVAGVQDGIEDLARDLASRSDQIGRLLFDRFARGGGIADERAQLRLVLREGVSLASERGSGLRPEALQTLDLRSSETETLLQRRILREAPKRLHGFPPAALIVSSSSMPWPARASVANGVSATNNDEAHRHDERQRGA